MTRVPHDPHHPTLPAPPADDRGAKQLSPEENADLCAGCVRCCTYLSIEIDAPRAGWEYDQWIWALHHQGIEIYVEEPERWFIHVETRCRQLNDEGRCRIHGRHPVLCREYDPRSCERRQPLSGVRAWFRDAESLEQWVARERPSHWRRLLRWREATPAGPPLADARQDRRAAAALVPLAGLAAAPAKTARSGRRTLR